MFRGSSRLAADSGSGRAHDRVALRSSFARIEDRAKGYARQAAISFVCFIPVTQIVKHSVAHVDWLAVSGDELELVDRKAGGAE